MSSFNPTKHNYLLLKITHENYKKYLKYMHVPLGDRLGFDLREEIYVHASAVHQYDYVCSSDEEFDQLIFLHYLEN